MSPYGRRCNLCGEPTRKRELDRAGICVDCAIKRAWEAILPAACPPTIASSPALCLHRLHDAVMALPAPDPVELTLTEFVDLYEACQWREVRKRYPDAFTTWQLLGRPIVIKPGTR